MIEANDLSVPPSGPGGSDNVPFQDLPELRIKILIIRHDDGYPFLVVEEDAGQVAAGRFIVRDPLVQSLTHVLPNSS